MPNNFIYFVQGLVMAHFQLRVEKKWVLNHNKNIYFLVQSTFGIKNTLSSVPCDKHNIMHEKTLRQLYFWKYIPKVLCTKNIFDGLGLIQP